MSTLLIGELNYVIIKKGPFEIEIQTKTILRKHL